MKKLAYLLAAFITIFCLAACNHQQDESTNQEKPTSHVQEGTTNPEKPATPVKEGTTDPETPAAPEKEGAKDSDQPTTPAPETKVYQNNVFKEVIVTEKEDKIMVTGKAQVFEGVFQYALHDGEKVVLENNYQTDGAPAWGKFEITFEKGLVSSNNVKLELFVYSAKDGSKVNTLEIPIPKQK
ncbi:sporulation protein [Neobacillus drentensis]|uniref:Gmad2 immunoglobulin-like domain-containing protein n=1 Tax=Neobacillus drentensis TaxID=220684 RepID=UPI001F21912E|nr:Gmad2 immunoglobulin-like domain-containing protein [Neobacillus drentensis]ULT54687.1 sporulation protein [Neobacillus drentensis]